MKIRLGFVSNSSSASFSINKNYLTPAQLQSIKDTLSGAIPIKSNDEFNTDNPEYIEDWIMSDRGDYLQFETMMDNFDLIYYLLKDLRIPEHALKGE